MLHTHTNQDSSINNETTFLDLITEKWELSLVTKLKKQYYIYTKFQKITTILVKGT